MLKLDRYVTYDILTKFHADFFIIFVSNGKYAHTLVVKNVIFSLKSSIVSWFDEIPYFSSSQFFLIPQNGILVFSCYKKNVMATFLKLYFRFDCVFVNFALSFKFILCSCFRISFQVRFFPPKIWFRRFVSLFLLVPFPARSMEFPISNFFEWMFNSEQIKRKMCQIFFVSVNAPS